MPQENQSQDNFEYLLREIWSSEHNRERTIQALLSKIQLKLKEQLQKRIDEGVIKGITKENIDVIHTNIYMFAHFLNNCDNYSFLADARDKFFKKEDLNPTEDQIEKFVTKIGGWIDAHKGEDDKFNKMQGEFFRSFELAGLYQFFEEILNDIFAEKLKQTRAAFSNEEIKKNKEKIGLHQKEREKNKEDQKKYQQSKVIKFPEIEKDFSDSDKEVKLKGSVNAKISIRENYITDKTGKKAHDLEDRATVTGIKIDSSWQNHISELLTLVNTAVVAKLNQNETLDSEKQGATAVYLLVTENEKKQKQVHVLNVGDSFSAMITQKGIQLLAVPHKPTDPSEEARIKSEGSFVVNSRVLNWLATSRSIGDQNILGVDYNGTVSSYDVPKDEKNTVFMVASDGIDPLSLQMIADISQKEKNNIAAGCCNKVLETDGRRDDVTVVTVPGTGKDFLVVLNDGHGGKAVAEYVNKEAPEIFQKIAATPRNEVTVDFLKREILNEKAELESKEGKQEEKEKIENIEPIKSQNVSAKTEDSTKEIIEFLKKQIDLNNFKTKTTELFVKKTEENEFNKTENIAQHFKEASKNFSPFRARSMQRFYKSIAEDPKAVMLAYNVLTEINNQIQNKDWEVGNDQLVNIPIPKLDERSSDKKPVPREAAEIVKFYEKALTHQITWQRALDEVETILSRNYVLMQDKNAPILAIQNPDNLNDIREKFKKIEEEGKQQKNSEDPFVQKGRLVISKPKETLDLYHKWFLDIQKDYHDKLLPNIDNSALFDVIFIDENKINRTLIELEKKILGKVNDILLLKRAEIDDKNTVRRTLDALAYDLFQWSQKIPFGTRNSSPVYNAIMKKIESFYTKSDVLSNEDSNTIRKRAETRIRDNKEIYKARSQLLNKPPEQPHPQSQLKM